MITMIWAQDKNGLIGKNGQLPWRLPNDLKFFKEQTLHQTIVMGRVTFEGMGKRLLPNRDTIILTRDANYDANGATVMTSVEDILTLSKNKPIFILGGSSIYQLFAPHASQFIKTEIEGAFEGDAYIPEMPYEQFVLEETIDGITDEKNHHPHTFKFYKRKTEK